MGMLTPRPLPAISLANISIRRERLMEAVSPAGMIAFPEEDAAPQEGEEQAGGWIGDLRFFLTCYVAGVIFFWVILS